MEPYGYHYAFTDAIIQHGKAKAKLKVFGDPDHNVQFANGVLRQLKDMGHVVEYVYSKRSKVISKLGHVVIAEEEYRRKYEGLPPFAANERSAYVDEWKRGHEKEITKQLGYKTGPQFEFLSGILFATSTSKVTVPALQNVSVCIIYFEIIIIINEYQPTSSSPRSSKPTPPIFNLGNIHYSRRMHPPLIRICLRFHLLSCSVARQLITGVCFGNSLCRRIRLSIVMTSP